MTVLGAVFDRQGNLYVGTDSAIVSGDILERLGWPKWVEGPRWLLLVSGYAAYMSWLEDLPELLMADCDATEVARAIRERLKSEGFTDSDKAAHVDSFRGILVDTFGPEVFEIDALGGLLPRDSFCFCGSGTSAAMGAFAAISAAGYDGEEALTRALGAACSVSTSCSMPLYIRHIDQRIPPSRSPYLVDNQENMP